ncbi:MAG: amino acid adenylation domain-containing protein, partial [Planctomycetota bacterium]
RLALPLGLERSRKLRELAEDPAFRGLSPDLSAFHVFATALIALLQRVRESTPEVSLLTPIHNRSSRAFRSTMGVFIEVLPLTVEAEPTVTLRDLGGRIQRSMRDCLAHGVPGASSMLSAAAPSEVVLNFIGASFGGGFAGRPATSRWLHPGHGDPAHALRVQVHDFGKTGEFTVDLDVHCDVFGSEERSAIQRHFLAVLDGLLENPDRPLETLTLLSPAESEVRDARLDRAAEKQTLPSVIDAIEARFADSPGAVAIQSGDETLTYADLDRASARAALALRAQGVDPGDLVALHLPRSPAFVVLLVATLRLGAAYVPLDRGLPVARKAALLERIAPRVLVHDGDEVTAFWAGASAAAAQLQDGARGEDRLDRAAPCSSETRAYVIFTSGSTGMPKGVEIPHGALANYVAFAARQYAADAPLTFAFFSPIAVDLTVTSIFVPLTTGGALHVYPEASAANGGADLTVFDVFDDNACDIVKLTPAHLALLVQRGPVRASRLRTLVVGGEDLRRPLARRVQDELGSDVAIFNEYGPTEATVGCMVHRFDLDATAGSSVPIGRPIPGVRLRVENGAGQPVPDGVPGELLVGGACLSSGYLGDEAATEAAFGAETRDDRRLYRTGDLVRIDARTGDLVFLGRRDDQVKIRGVRIELAEVQTALESIPGVTAAAVLATAPERSESRGGRADLQLRGDPRWAGVEHCVRCGLASNHPEARLSMSSEGVCAVCLEFEAYRDAAQSYFGTAEELVERLERGRAAARKNGSKYDCLALLSGGKDSTYSLYQLVELGYHPLVFSLDNGYIAEGAQANIRRVVEHLGLDLVFEGTGSTSSMAAIFADSLDRFSNVCQGCFKTIYTLSTALAKKHGIQTIVTGLSRGQIFETRLAPIFRAGVSDPEEVDALIVEARKAYHRVDDAVARHLDTSDFERDEVFEEVQFVDFYRYWDVPLAEVLDFIGTRAAWRRPADTGRSTNCLINDVGIAVHKFERGFHNYALPYSWDVRLGHKTRDECLDELDDEIDDERVQRILREIGADGSGEGLTSELTLTAFFVGPRGLDVRAQLAERLPESMLPQAFVALEALPITAAGKVDRARLLEAGRAAAASRSRPHDAAQGATKEASPLASTRPRNVAAEEALAGVWRAVLQLDEVGLDEAFLDLGGDSILGMQVVARSRAAGWKITARDVFTHPTISSLARVAEAVELLTGGDDVSPLGEVPLSPVQRLALRLHGEDPNPFAMSMVLEPAASAASQRFDEDALRKALHRVSEHHDALRASFRSSRSGWLQEVLSHLEAPAPELAVVDLAEGEDASRAAQELFARFDVARGQMLGAALVRRSGAPDQLIVAVHHLSMDAVSWQPLLADLGDAYTAALADERAELPARTAPWRAWVRHLRDAARSNVGTESRARWESVLTVEATDRASGAAAGGLGLVRDEARVSRTLDTSVSARARSAGAADAVLGALAAAWRDPASDEASTEIIVDVETHGRISPTESQAAPDVSRTLGWFTAMHPVRLESGGAMTEQLTQVRAAESATRDDRALFGFVLPDRHGCGDVLFNYLGAYATASLPGSPFRVARGLELERPAGSARSHRLHLFATEHADGRIELHAEHLPSLDSTAS